MKLCDSSLRRCVYTAAPTRSALCLRSVVPFRLSAGAGSAIVSLQGQYLAFCARRDIPTSRLRRKRVGATAWAGEVHTAAKSSSESADLSQSTPDFKHLCHHQLKLLTTILQKPGGHGTRATLYRREPATFDAGQLHLSRVASFTEPGVQSAPADLDSTLHLGLAGNSNSARGAEKALTQAHLIDLPNTGALVLPLAAHTFLVGLLVIEQLALLPQLPAGPDEADQQQVKATDKQLTPAGSVMHKGGNDVLLSCKDREVVQMCGQVLASACAMDLHSALERAQAAMHSQQVLGLVEQVRGPLTALRTLGTILVPRLRHKEGLEIDRDVAQGILTQGERLQEVVTQLQAAIHPIGLPAKTAPFGQQELPLPSRGPAETRTLPLVKEKASKPLLPKPKPDSSADDELRIK